MADERGKIAVSNWYPTPDHPWSCTICTVGSSVLSKDCCVGVRVGAKYSLSNRAAPFHVISTYCIVIYVCPCELKSNHYLSPVLSSRWWWRMGAIGYAWWSVITLTPRSEYLMIVTAVPAYK